MRNLLRHLTGFILPVFFCLILPYWLLRGEQGQSFPALAGSAGWLAAGVILTGAGVACFAGMAAYLIREGCGTLMPWDPPRKLVTGGPYAYVRNPVIMSVVTLQAGEACLFGSYNVALLALIFFFINTFYFIGLEEPSLERRFGGQYLEYKKNVPRWIPRRKPWKG